jgi:hypothetical protein
MKVFTPTNEHSDNRRDLSAFQLPPEFPTVAETKVLVVKGKAVELGRHYHPHPEGFLLAAGSCVVRTWTPGSGVCETEIHAPQLFMFEAQEEHLLTCEQGTVLVGYMPVTFSDENNTPAIHV